MHRNAIALTTVFAACTLQASAWDTTISAGLNVTSGNSETIAANGGVESRHEGETQKIRLVLQGNYGESEIEGTDEKTIDKLTAAYEHRYQFNGSYLYANNSILRDDIAAIHYRMILGMGVGYRVIQKEHAKLGLELGLAYIREDIGERETTDDIAFRAAARHDQQLGEGARLWAAIEYLPQADDFEIYLINSEAGAEASLNNQLSLRVVLDHRHDSDVPANRDRNDLSLISALIYQL